MTFLGGVETVIIYGVIYGGALSVLALGMSFVFGVAKVMDLSYAAYIALAAYVLFSFSNTNAPLAIALIVSPLAVVPLALFVERLLIRPMLTVTNGVMMATFGVSLIAEKVITLVWGGTVNAIRVYVSGSMTIVNTVVSSQRLMQLPISILCVLALLAFVGYTKHGKAVSAVSQDRDAAWLVGINVNATMALTVALGALLAGVSSVLVAPTGPIIPGMGWTPLLAAFPIVLIGGLGSVKGTVVASYMFALFTNFVIVFIGSQWGNLAAFLFLLVVLLVRPGGLFAKPD
jgi:branched-chain amino acid transport system permease protein